MQKELANAIRGGQGVQLGGAVVDQTIDHINWVLDAYTELGTDEKKQFLRLPQLVSARCMVKQQ